MLNRTQGTCVICGMSFLLARGFDSFSKRPVCSYSCSCKENELWERIVSAMPLPSVQVLKELERAAPAKGVAKEPPKPKSELEERFGSLDFGDE